MIKELGDCYRIENEADYYELCRHYGIIKEETPDGQEKPDGK